MIMMNDNGVVSLRSPHSVAHTLTALEKAVLRAGLKIVANIDHSSAATHIGIAMAPTELIIFGNALSGTPLMLAAPTAAIDLPLKGLAWQDNEGAVWLSYNDPLYVGKRHQIPSELLPHIEGIRRICEEAVSGLLV